MRSVGFGVRPLELELRMCRFLAKFPSLLSVCICNVRVIVIAFSKAVLRLTPDTSQLILY